MADSPAILIHIEDDGRVVFKAVLESYVQGLGMLDVVRAALVQDLMTTSKDIDPNPLHNLSPTGTA